MNFLGLILFLILSPVIAAGPVPGLEGPVVSIARGKLLLTMKMPEAVLSQDRAFGVTGEKLSQVSYRAAEDGGMLLEMGLDMDELQSVSFSDVTHNALPDGRAIPGVPGGAVKDSHRRELGHGFISFHSAKSFGLAIPLSWDLGQTREGHHWLNWKGKNIGMLSVTPALDGKKAYAFVFIRFAGVRGNSELMKKIRKH